MTELWREMPLAEPPEPEGESWRSMPLAAPASEAPTNRRGAPVPWRVAVSLAETPEDQRTTLRTLQAQGGLTPDAEWVTFGEPGGERLSRQTGTAYQVEDTSQTALVYTNPDTGQQERFDPKGFSLEDLKGDLAEQGVPIARVLAYLGGLGIGTWLGGANPYAGHLTGVAASQGVQHGAEPLVESLMDIDIAETRGAGEQTLEGLMDVGLEGSLPLMGGAVGRPAQQALRAPFRRRAWQPRGLGQPEVVAGIEEMAVAEGMDPQRAIRGAAAMATGSPTVQGFYQALRKYPKAADIMKRRVDDTLNLITRAFHRAQLKAGGTVERTEAGATVQKGLGGWRANKREMQVYFEDQVAREIGNDTPIAASRTAAFIQGRMAQAEGMGRASRMAVPKEYRDVLQGIEETGGAPRLQAFRAVREAIGPKGSRGLALPGHASADDMDALYAAMSEDLGQAAAQKGGKAAAAWGNAQKNWASLKAREETLKAVINAETGKQAFEAAVRGNDPEILGALRQSLVQEDWDSLVSTRLWELATTHTTAGARGEVTQVFSPTQFIRNWRGMSDSVKQALFPANGELRKQLNRLATVTAAEEGAQAMLNVSGTAQAHVYMEMVGRGALSQMVGADLSARQARVNLLQSFNPFNAMRMAQRQARLMTNADFVKWLADGGRGLATDPAKIGEHLGRLGGLAASRPELRDDIQGYLEDWQATLDEAEEGTTNTPQQPVSGAFRAPAEAPIIGRGRG